MHYYAQLNSQNICIGLSQLSGEVIADNMVALDTYDTSKLWHKYENGAWSAESYEPASTAPIDEWTQYKAIVDQLVADSLA